MTDDDRSQLWNDAERMVRRAELVSACFRLAVLVVCAFALGLAIAH